MLVELSVVEQRYQAVLAVIREGVPVAGRFGVSSQAAPGRPPARHPPGGPVMQIFDGDELLKTVLRANGKEVRKKKAARAR
jgi:hypothetical protein